MSVSLSVSKDSTVSLRDKAIQAFKLVDHDIDESKQYVLSYSDLKTQVEFLPQSKELFTPQKYVELVGTFYSKVRLYLVTKEDWRGTLVTIYIYIYIYMSCIEHCHFSIDTAYFDNIYIYIYNYSYYAISCL
jgi:hypothetical protein